MAGSRFALALALMAACHSFPAHAEDYPARPIRIIVPFGAGGPADIAARLVGNVL
jgi:tripartite-type tricarboxylate transporter receptor subunit TctC